MLGKLNILFEKCISVFYEPLVYVPKPFKIVLAMCFFDVHNIIMKSEYVLTNAWVKGGFCFMIFFPVSC